MAIDLYWDDDEHTTLLCEFNGRWTWDELHAVIRTIQNLSAKEDRVLRAIVDARGALHFSPGSIMMNANSFEQAKQLLQMGSKGTGPLVIVGSNPLFRTAYQILHRIDAKALNNTYFAETTEAARVLLAGLSRSDR